jgi:hypothetical protein
VGQFIGSNAFTFVLSFVGLVGADWAITRLLDRW